MAKIDVQKLMKLGLASLLFFFLAALVIVIIKTSSSNEKKMVLDITREFTLYQPLLPPEVFTMPDDYYLVRPRNYQWSKEDVKRWFTEPDGQLLKELHSANDNMISNILEAAP